LVTTTSTRSLGVQLISGRDRVLSWRILMGTAMPCRIMLVVHSKWGIGFFSPELISTALENESQEVVDVVRGYGTALQDVELGGKKILKGDKVVMWYLSGNRDEEAIDNPEAFIIDRARPRQHLSFGFGIHRCVGNRLAEMQLKILWEEILKRFPAIEVTGPPTRLLSNFVRGISDLPVRIPAG